MSLPTDKDLKKAQKIIEETIIAVNTSINLGQVTGNKMVEALTGLDIKHRIAQAIADERERCAKIAESVSIENKYWKNFNTPQEMKENIAKEIRNPKSGERK